MRFIVCFDISSDKLRNKVGTACRDFGLDRIQNSVWFGFLNKSDKTEIYLRIKRIMTKQNGRILICPVEETNWEKRETYEVGQNIQQNIIEQKSPGFL